MWGRLRTHLRDPFKHLIKETIWVLQKPYSEEVPGICVYSSRRGGSTLLMEALASQPHVSFSDQPFSLFVANQRNLNAIPIFEGGQIIDPDPDEWERIQQYISDLLRFNTVANAPWKILFRPDQLRPNRLVLKITDAKTIADGIHATFPVETIILFRHPIAQARSVIRNAWQLTGKAFLRNPTYVERYLSRKLVDFCWNVYTSGTLLEKHVLDWCLENRPLFQMIDSHPDWIHLHFEDLVLEPEKTAQQLANRLELPYPERIASTLQKPSRSTKKASLQRTRKAIRQRSKQQLLSTPLSGLEPRETRATQKILEKLEITCYQIDSPFPFKKNE